VCRIALWHPTARALTYQRKASLRSHTLVVSLMPHTLAAEGYQSGTRGKPLMEPDKSQLKVSYTSSQLKASHTSSWRLPEWYQRKAREYQLFDFYWHSWTLSFLWCPCFEGREGQIDLSVFHWCVMTGSNEPLTFQSFTKIVMYNTGNFSFFLLKEFAQNKIYCIFVIQ